MAEYEDNKSVSEVGAAEKAGDLLVKFAKFADYVRSYNPITSTWNAGVSFLGTIGSVLATGWNVFAGWIGLPAIPLGNPLGFFGQAIEDGAAHNGGIFAGLVAAGRGIQAANELSKGNKLKAVNTTIKGAVEAAVVFAMWGLPGMIIEPLSLLATGKAFSTQAGEAAARVAENIEESFIGKSADKKAGEAKKLLAEAGMQQPVYAQQPIMVQPQVVAQNMQPVVLASQPVIPNQMMPYVVQQEMSAPAGFTPKPANYWANYVAGEKVANQNKRPVAAVPQEAAAFSHAVAQAERKAATMQATAQQNGSILS